MSAPGIAGKASVFNVPSNMNRFLDPDQDASKKTSSKKTSNDSDNSSSKHVHSTDSYHVVNAKTENTDFGSSTTQTKTSCNQALKPQAGSHTPTTVSGSIDSSEQAASCKQMYENIVSIRKVVDDIPQSLSEVDKHIANNIKNLKFSLSDIAIALKMAGSSTSSHTATLDAEMLIPRLVELKATLEFLIDMDYIPTSIKHDDVLESMEKLIEFIYKF